jgi:cytochrome d ubiquinol oxidase subunit II
METLWFAIVAFMLAMYVILDGFDLGAGIVHRFVGKTREERDLVLKAIGSVWDGNEVWLIAAGGTLYFAFPMLYASSFSGFYLPLMIVLWLLILRGISIEFHHVVHHPMWKSFWDTVFTFASLLLAIFFGAALGNVVRGVPLDGSGYFFSPLWTTFTIVPNAGILDWFTVLMGLVALFTLTVHGANFIAMKTEGELRTRSRTVADRLWWGVVLTSIAAFISTFTIHPEFWDNFAQHSWGFVLPIGGVLGLGGMSVYGRRGNDQRAFISSSIFIGSMLASTAFALHPNVLPSSIDPAYNLTIYNTAAREYGLLIGTVWWTIGFVLAAGYFVYVYRAFRGKVTTESRVY